MIQEAGYVREWRNHDAIQPLWWGYRYGILPTVRSLQVGHEISPPTRSVSTQPCLIFQGLRRSLVVSWFTSWCFTIVYDINVATTFVGVKSASTSDVLLACISTITRGFVNLAVCWKLRIRTSLMRFFLYKLGGWGKTMRNQNPMI